MRFDLHCPALGATLGTTDPADAARWLVSVMAECPIGGRIAVLVNGHDRGSRIAARLMTVSEASVEAAIRSEMMAVRRLPANDPTELPLRAA
jgi:hypothetical protein